MVRSFLNLVGNFFNENNKTYDNQFKFSSWGSTAPPRPF